MRLELKYWVLPFLALLLVTVIATGQPSRSVSATGVVKLVSGAIHTCVVTGAGGVTCWGDGRFGQLGTPDALGCAASHIPCSREPVAVVGLSGDARDIAAGSDHTCALIETGSVQCWGLNAAGQLGSETNEVCSFDAICSVTPVEVPGLETIASLAAGGAHSCAVDAAGKASCWGDNSAGQLGNGTTIGGSAPANVSPLGEGIEELAAGGMHTCALTEAGGVFCWGDNRFGQLGTETEESCGEPEAACSTVPVAVPGLESGIAAVTAGATHTCADSDAHRDPDTDCHR